MKNSALFQSQAITFIFLQTPEDNTIKEMGAKLQPYAHRPGRIQQKPARPAAQSRVLSSLFPSQPPGSNLIPMVESAPPRKKTRGRSRGRVQGVLFLLSCPVSISSACSLPWETSLWGRDQSAGQSVIRSHLVSGGSASPQALS